MGSNQRPEWEKAKWGMLLNLPFHEKNREFLVDMKKIVPEDERRWDREKKNWWISDAYLDEVDQLLFHYFETQGHGRDQ